LFNVYNKTKKHNWARKSVQANAALAADRFAYAAFVFFGVISVVSPICKNIHMFCV
jgi:hypothetical protein